MAFTQEQLDELDAKILAAGAVKQTQFADQSTTFRDLEEMLRLRAIIAASLAGNRTRYGATQKGT